MIPVEEARARILAGIAATSPEVVPLAAAWGRVLAAPVLARLTQPPRDVSAMDGYALRAADGLIEIAEDVPEVKHGDLVSFIPFAEFGIRR